jgi:hypothetical protein
MRAHRLVDTSCILCYQCSRPSFEYDAHELILLQLSAPSTVQVDIILHPRSHVI